ncbi:helix-turn-helix domain-containing protein [Dyadobacter jiangsuensis]|uniref:AraC family transcriptional regulator n=1 Tax=Dyadobacter jiangsuensis TaxID=1591085 RepID=A0A2P8FU69_9BACT|nr:helix-turn-helix domain-containing protein [Dyadobacter jiangsuensis]PSL25185.1 AraC family transcriptional regulator [Dyadobacter jiangsuensis]
MKYFTILPSADLARYVRFFWVLEHNLADSEPYFHKTMADGCAEMVFHFKGRFDEILKTDQSELSFRSGIHGQSQSFRRFRIGEDFGIFGVYLYPFALPALFNIPAAELSNQMPDLTTFLGQAGTELEERVMLAADHAERIHIISEFLRARIRKHEVHEPAVFSVISSVIRSNGLAKIPDLAAQSFLSTRQFERKFLAFSGFTPKLFSRIIRFHSALNEYGNKEKSLTEIAYECGYYDQSHFIHDFKAFSGDHPKTYFSGNAEGMGYRDV